MWIGRNDDGARETLLRIVLFLLSLAGMAQRSAYVRPTLRRYLLGLFHASEIAALTLLCKAPAECRPYLLWEPPDDDSAEGALLTAFRLRLLAFLIAQMAQALHNAATRLGRVAFSLSADAASVISFVCSHFTPTYVDTS